jgi:putative transcriptional regulator
MKKVNDNKSPSVGEEIIQGLTGLRDALANREKIYKRFTMRTVNLVLEPQEFTAEEITALRKTFRASQTVFAMLIGVKPSTLRNWEQGRTSPPAWGRRLLEVMQECPEPFRVMLEKGAEEKQATCAES